MATERTLQVDGESVTRLRILKGWSAEELADKAGVSVGSISNAHKSERMQVKSIKLIADALGVYVQNILKQRTMFEPLPPERQWKIMITITPPADEMYAGHKLLTESNSGAEGLTLLIKELARRLSGELSNIEMAIGSIHLVFETLDRQMIWLVMDLTKGLLDDLFITHVRVRMRRILGPGNAPQFDMRYDKQQWQEHFVELLDLYEAESDALEEYLKNRANTPSRWVSETEM